MQRVRLVVNFLEEFGWKPIIIAVKPGYYEEEQAQELVKLVKPTLRVAYVDAKHLGKFRLYGDIALRAFGNMKKRALEIIQREKIDCMWLPIPPFYTALIGRRIHDATGVPYAIDYIDPWVHDFPGSHKLFSRAKLASLVAKFLEPIAVKKASAFTGVSSAYYLPVFERNPHLKGIPHAGMPYGFDPYDYSVKPDNQKLLWSDDGDVKPYVYAGAFLPNAHYFIQQLFGIIAEMRKSGEWDRSIRFYFVGTGRTNLSSVAEYARQFGIDDIVKEKQERISYLEVLNNLSNAAGVLAIGSTEQHYTASKIFQSLLSKRPVFAVFHHESTVVNTLSDTGANNYLVTYDEREATGQFVTRLQQAFYEFITLKKGWAPQLDNLDKYSARASAKALAEVLDRVVGRD